MDDPRADGGDGLERRMRRVEQLLAGGQELAFRAERVGRLGFLFVVQGLASTKQVNASRIAAIVVRKRWLTWDVPTG